MLDDLLLNLPGMLDCICHTKKVVGQGLTYKEAKDILDRADGDLTRAVELHLLEDREFGS